jgi:hypothetical protein
MYLAKLPRIKKYPIDGGGGGRHMRDEGTGG